MNNDLISRSETEKLLRAYADKVGCEHGEYELANGILKAVCFLEESENVPAVSEWKWIPCSERLPENRMDVLVSFLHYDPAIAWYSKINNQWKNSATDRNITAEIIAWMPIPEPYHEVKNNAK